MNRSAEVAKQQLDGGHAGCPVCAGAVSSGDFVVGGRLMLVQAGVEALQTLGRVTIDGLHRPSSFAAA
jgi:hypothetical protein